MIVELYAVNGDPSLTHILVCFIKKTNEVKSGNNSLNSQNVQKRHYIVIIYYYLVVLQVTKK